MIQARLQGGPYDGAEEDLDGYKPPNLLGVWTCPGCNGIHMAPYFEIRNIDGQHGIALVRYRFARLDARGALYRYADLNRPDPDGMTTPANTPDQKEENRSPLRIQRKHEERVLDPVS